MKRILLVGYFIILLTLTVSKCYCQPTFVQRAGGNYSDFGMSCAPTSDGGTILAQETCTNGMDLHSGLIKLDYSGNMQWNTLYQIGDYTIPYTVLEAKDEGYIVLTFSSDSSYVNNNRHFLGLYKTDNSGLTIWNKQYSLSNNDLPLNLVHRKSGGYYSFSVGDYNLGGYPTTIVTRYDDNGNLIWSKQYTAPYGLRGIKGIEMPDNNICFIATLVDPATLVFVDVAVVMLDPSGNIIWTKNFGSYYDDEPNSLAANSANDIFITGRNYFLNREWDSFLIRLDRFGNKISSRVYDGGTSNGEIMRCILAFDDGTCKLLGDMGTFDERDITLMNIDSNLSVTSAKRYRFSPMFTNYPFDFYRASDGGLVFTGDYRPPTADRDAIIVKTESDGSLPCYVVTPAITEFNEFFHDTIINISSQVVSHNALNFPAVIPVNPISDHVVCSFTADVGDNNSEILSSVFPNPFSSALTFTFKNNPQSDFLITVTDMTGRIVYSAKEQSAKDDKLTIKLSHLSKGAYILKIQTLQALIAKRIVRQ